MSRSPMNRGQWRPSIRRYGGGAATYRVMAGERAFAHAVLAPRVIEPVLTLEPFTWHIDGADLIAAGPLPSLEAMQHKLEVLHQVALTIPDFLYRS